MSASIREEHPEDHPVNGCGMSAELDVDVDNHSVEFRSAAHGGPTRMSPPPMRARASVGNLRMRDHRDERVGTTGGTRRPQSNAPMDAPNSAQRRAQMAVEHQRAYIEDRRQSERQHHAQVRYTLLVGTNEALGS